MSFRLENLMVMTSYPHILNVIGSGVLRNSNLNLSCCGAISLDSPPCSTAQNVTHDGSKGDVNESLELL
ncbi:hypothetical protein [Metallosphaera hakonensis]|nr:hypothetical protein [Metallosphaera hakonensis]